MLFFVGKRAVIIIHFSNGLHLHKQECLMPHSHTVLHYIDDFNGHTNSTKCKKQTHGNGTKAYLVFVYPKHLKTFCNLKESVTQLKD